MALTILKIKLSEHFGNQFDVFWSGVQMPLEYQTYLLIVDGAILDAAILKTSFEFRCHSNQEPFDNCTHFRHLNPGLALYFDPHYTSIEIQN